MMLLLSLNLGSYDGLEKTLSVAPQKLSSLMPLSVKEKV